MWTGYILRGKEKVIAGWCSMRCYNSEGFHGHYLEKMKLEEDD